MSDNTGDDRLATGGGADELLRYVRWGSSLDDLVAVIPIAQSRTVGDATLTLFSLEVFADGMRLRGRIRFAGPSVTNRYMRFPHPVYEVRDDRGAVYRVRDAGGHGSPGEWEFTALCDHALDLTAQQLVITIPAIDWRELDESSLEPVESQEPVNLRFDVTIPAAG